MGANKVRLSDLLVNEGLFPDGEAALRAIIAGEVLVDDIVATSAAQSVAEGASLRVRRGRRYVSRGGEKLKSAIDAFGIDVSGLKCIDIGSSTGGFSDCLLQEGASEVACVDVNYGQLAWSVRNDPRTRVFERTNIKEASPPALGAPFDVVVIDVSFIGLASLARTIASLSARGAHLIALVKPQFESRRGETDGGVVRSEAVRLRTVQEVEEALRNQGFSVQGAIESPVRGPAGNVEYLVHAIFDAS